MKTIRYDMSQFYPLKSVLEQILGKRAYRKLKESAALPEWRVEITKLLKAIELSILETVKVADPEFYEEANEILGVGRDHVSSARDISELFAGLSATLARIAFLQIGYIPTHDRVESVSLIQKNWNLACVRSVQYVQSATQKETSRRLAEQKIEARSKNAP